MKIRVQSARLLAMSVVALMAVSACGGVGEGDYGQPQVIVQAPTETARRHLAWPKIVRTADGKLVVACVSGSKHAGNAGGLEAVAVSADDGATFSALNVLANPEGDSRWTEGGNLALSVVGSRVVMLSMTYAGDNSTSGIYGRISDDSGATWSVTDTSGISPDKTGSVFGHIINIPGRGLTAFGHYRLPARAKVGGTWMASSADNGATWGAPTCILDRDGFVEPDFVYSQGRIIGLIREDLGNSVTLNGYWQIVSDNNGATWSEPTVVMAGASGDHSAAPCIVEDAQNPGRLYVVQTVRRGTYGTSNSTGEIVLWTAEATTLNWKRIGTVATFSGIEDFGYASAAQIEGNEWFVVFYAGLMNGANSIYGVRCTFDPNPPALSIQSASISGGALTLTANCRADGRLWLASGATDGGDSLEGWDNLTFLRDVASGDHVNVSASLPDGAAFARVVLREVVHTKTVVTNKTSYLESDGGQYLEVDYALKSTDRVVAQVMALQSTQNSGDQAGIFGSRAAANDRNICALWANVSGVSISDGKGSMVVDFNNSDYTKYRQDWSPLDLSTIYTIDLSAAERKVLKDGVEITPRSGKKGACTDAAFVTSTNCRLFDIPNKPSSYKHCFIGRFYSFKIYESGNASPVRNLVPFVDGDGKAKMKDLVTGEAYPNLGTGNFTYGENIEEEVVEEEVVDGPAIAWSQSVTPSADPFDPVVPVVDPSEYGTTCLTLPAGANVNGADSTATFATLGVSTAYTYAFSIKNPIAQTLANGRYYGHIMGAGASNTKSGSQKGAPLLIESNDTTGERYIEVQTWTSGNKAQCLTILGYSSANTSWTLEKSQEVQALEDGEWHDVVFTYDATAQHAQVFVDGVKLHDITSSNLAEYLNYTDAGSTFATPSTSGAFCIGRNSAKNDNFAGSLSNVSVWNRALSAEEAVAISGARLAGNETGLVLYWPLDGETGDVTASDHQVNITAHDGTVYSAGTTTCGTYWEEMGTKVPTIVATVTGAAGMAGDGPYSCSLTVTKPASGYAVEWFDETGVSCGSTAPSYDAIGLYTNVVKVTAEDYLDFYGTGVVVVTAVPVEPVAGPPEYVDVTQNVCVETGVKICADDRVEVKFNSLNNATTFSVFCQRDRNVTGAPNRFFLFGVSSSGLKWNFDYAGQHSNDNIFGSVTPNTDYEFVCSTNGIFCNGVKAAYVPTYEDFEANSTMELFASRNATTDVANNFANLRFYWLRVYDASGALKAEILPRVRTAGGSANNDGCVLVRQYADGVLVSEEEKFNESGLSGKIKAGPLTMVYPMTALVTGAEGTAGEGPYSCSLTVISPEGGYAVEWFDETGVSRGSTAPSYDTAGVYTNVVTVTAEGYLDFVGTGVVEIVAAPAPRKKQGLIIYGTR